MIPNYVSSSNLQRFTQQEGTLLSKVSMSDEELELATLVLPKAFVFRLEWYTRQVTGCKDQL